MLNNFKLRLIEVSHLSINNYNNKGKYHRVNSHSNNLCLGKDQGSHILANHLNIIISYSNEFGRQIEFETRLSVSNFTEFNQYHLNYRLNLHCKFSMQ